MVNNIYSMIKKCTHCNIEYNPTGRNQKYCSNCRSECYSQVYRHHFKSGKYKQSKNEYMKERRSKDPLFKLSNNIRNLIKNSFNSKKPAKTESILGCSMEQFKSYIEKRFDENMTWDNYGTYWEYDHVIPVSKAYDEEELIYLNRYYNLRPLPKEKNRKKSDSWELEASAFFYNFIKKRINRIEYYTFRCKYTGTRANHSSSDEEYYRSKNCSRYYNIGHTQLANIEDRIEPKFGEFIFRLFDTKLNIDNVAFGRLVDLDSNSSEFKSELRNIKLSSVFGHTVSKDSLLKIGQCVFEQFVTSKYKENYRKDLHLINQLLIEQEEREKESKDLHFLYSGLD